MWEKINKFLVWAWLAPDYEEEERKMIIAEKLEIEHQEMVKEDERRKNENWINHINHFYGIIRERRLESISRKYYRERHLKGNTSFISLQKQTND